MTAYEMADLMIQFDSGRIWEHAEEIANMLRLQADRIAELEKQSEPVAWIRSGDDQLSLVKEKDDGYMVWKPLYLAPQTKSLSDEEIYELWCEADNTELLPEMRMKDGSINYIITTFARAIEERHGIK